MNLEREEEFSFKLKLKGNNLTPKDKERITKLFDIFVADGDEININYNFYIHYFGGIVERLETIIALMDKGEVTKIKSKELKHARCLAQEFWYKMQELEQKTYRKRTFPWRRKNETHRPCQETP